MEKNLTQKKTRATRPRSFKAWVTSLFVAFFSGVYVGCVYKSVPPSHTVPGEAIEIYFSPNGGARDAVIAEINKAKHSIYIFAYAFTCPKILEALQKAENRGVEIHTYYDNLQAKHSSSLTKELCEISKEYFKNSGKIKIQHIKTMVIDEDITLTGSFNFTISGEENNAENLLVIHNHAASERYINIWKDYTQKYGKATKPSFESSKRKKN